MTDSRLTDTQREDLRRYAESINGSEHSYGATILRLMTENESLRSLRAVNTCDDVLVDTLNQTAEDNAELKETVAVLRKDKDAVYSERDMLVCFFAKFAVVLGWKAWVGLHEGEQWDADWLNVVYVVTPYGQVSWHVHDSEVEWFSFLPRREAPGWDGHTSVEKYARLGSIALREQEPDDTKLTLEDEICMGAATQKMREYVDLMESKVLELQKTHDAAIATNGESTVCHCSSGHLRGSTCQSVSVIDAALTSVDLED
jgi:hypothetical protein